MNFLLPQKWVKQPQIPVGADFSNPIVSASQGAFLVNFGGSNREMIRGRVPTLNSPANIATGYGTLGKGLKMTAATGSRVEYAGYGSGTRTAWTIAFVVQHAASYAGTEHVMSLDTDGNGIRVEFNFQFGGAPPRVELVKSGVAGLGNLITPGNAFNEPYFYILSHDEATDVFYYRIRNLLTGARASTDSTSTSVATSCNGTYNFGDLLPTLTDDAFSGQILMGYIGHAFLPEQLAEQWLRNPWQIFRPMPQRSYMNFDEVVAGGGGSPYYAYNQMMAA